MIPRGQAAGISRRSALQVSGLALAGAALTPGTAQHAHIAFGVNRHYYPAFTAAVPGTRSVRIYYDAENVFPGHWPDQLPGAWATLSIRPRPRDLLSGKLDGPIRNLLGTAPDHSELSIWHEAGPGNPLGYPDYVNADNMFHMHAYMQHLCTGTNVRYGSIICGPANQCQPWLGRNLDWYGVDLYDNSRYHNPDGTLNPAKLYSRMDANLAMWRVVAGTEHPSIRLCETNSPFDSHRRHWFSLIATWMARHNGRRILTYWNSAEGKARGGLSGPWPPSHEVVLHLHHLVTTYGG